MADDTVHVKGLKECAEFLRLFPDKLQNNILRSAFRAGGKVIEAQAKTNVPVSPPSGENARVYGGYAGALRDSIRTTTRNRGDTVTASIRAGGKGRSGANVYYAHMVEMGTDPHVIRAANGGKLKIAGGFYDSVNHPGAAARPYMVPAMDTQAQNAVVAVGNQIKKRLTKQGLDTADILIEGDE